MGVWPRKSERTHFQPGECAAYQWPHRPGGGLCRWPDPPLYSRTTPRGKRKHYHQIRRGSLAWQLRALMRQPGEF